MSAKKPYRKVTVTARRDVDLIDKKPFRKPISPVPRPTVDAQLELIGMPVEPEREIKATKPKPAVKRQKKAPPPPVVKVAPWANAGEEMDTLRAYRMSRVTFAKINWIKSNVLRMNSLQKILDSFVLDGIEKLLKEHYKDTE